MRVSCRIALFSCLIFGDFMTVAETGRSQPDFARSGGVYASGAHGGVFGRLNTFRAHPDQDINARLRAGRDNGLINIVQLSHGHRWNEELEAGMSKLETWLERTDLSLVDAVHFAEEQPYNAVAWLDPLYDLVKAHDPTLSVYVWPTYPLGPMGKADGYVYDAYGEGYMDSRERFMTFLRTGKPLIMCVDASGFSDYRLAREQLMACHERDIPVFYFVADSGSGSYNNWYGKPTRALAGCRNFMFSAMEFQRRCREPEPITAADLVWGDSIEVAPDESGKVQFSWSEFGPATLYGFTRLALDGESVRNESSRDVAMDYQFWSLFPIKNARLILDASPGDAERIQVFQSRCGKADEWQPVEAIPTPEGLQCDLGDVGREFRLRVSLAPGAIMRGGRITGECALPSERAIDLSAYYDGWRKRILFHQEMDTGLWRAMATIDRPELLGAGNALALHGRDGRSVRLTVVEQFSSDVPLEDIHVRLTGMSQASLGGSFSLGLSLDGKTIFLRGRATSQPRADGKYDGAYTVDASETEAFQGIKTFYVHMTQANNAGLQTNTSSRLEALEINARRVEQRE